MRGLPNIDKARDVLDRAFDNFYGYDLKMVLILFGIAAILVLRRLDATSADQTPDEAR